MANWIKWVKGLALRREVAVLSSRLGLNPHEVAGRLMVFWEWCDDNFSDDDVDDENVSLILGDNCPSFVDALCGFPGFAEALSSPEINWIQFRSGGRVVFPNLARHNGTSAKTRALGASKKEKQRKNSSENVSRKCPQKKGTREDKSIPPNPQMGEFNSGKRKRDQFPPLPDRTAPSVKAWIKTVERIPRDTVTVGKIVAAAERIADESELFFEIDRIARGQA